MLEKELRRWIDDRRWVADVALAGFIAFLSLIVDRGAFYQGNAALLFWTVVMVSPLLVRRTYPMIAVGSGVFVLLLNLLTMSTPTVPIVMAPILVHTAAAYLPRPWRLGTLLAGLAGSVLAPLRWWYYQTDVTVIAMGIGLCAVTVVAASVIGERQRTRVERIRSDVERDRERAGFLRTQDEQRSQVTLAAERARIARELHDIVAHSLSVVIVQAQGARAVVDAKPELAGPVLDTIAETSRSALAEMRTLVGVLRGDDTDDSGAEYAPAQGIADVPDLIETIRTSGVPVELEVSGDQPPLPPGLDLTVYRLIQESLTNVLKHGGPGVRATVELRFWEGLIQVDVLDDGRGAAAVESPDGHGLIGMRERVSAMGGQVTTQPRPGGGFAVRARFPLPTRATP